MLLWFVLASGGFWQSLAVGCITPVFPWSSHGSFPNFVCSVSVCFQIFSFEGISGLRTDPNSVDLILTNYMQKPFCQIKSVSEVLDRHELGGRVG